VHCAQYQRWAAAFHSVCCGGQLARLEAAHADLETEHAQAKGEHAQRCSELEAALTCERQRMRALEQRCAQPAR